MLVTWWGHSTVTTQWAQTRLLFDPVLGNSIAHLRRRRGPAPTARARDADAVVVSHLHADHCHLPSLRMLAPGTRVIGPAGLAAFLRRSNLRTLSCQEVVAGEEVEVGDLLLRALFAEHDDRRAPMSRFRAPPLSFLVTDRRGDGSPLWFGGDTALHEGIAKVAPVAVALVPVAGWGPGLGPGHLDAERAAEAVGLLSAGLAIPIHFGTFWPRGLGRVADDQFLGPERRFDEHCRQVTPHTTVSILSPGETLDTAVQQGSDTVGEDGIRT
jgi:L-ascorbate metabolism protein UlaG (beta-lactamase superfamily)